MPLISDKILKNYITMENRNDNTALFNEFIPVPTELWEEKINADLKGADYEKKLIWSTYEGIKIKPYYRAENIKDLDYQRILPGDYPFIRGFSNKSNLWEIIEKIEIDDVPQANIDALNAIQRGATAISFNGKNLAGREELELLLKGINLNEIAIHFSSSKSFTDLARDFVDYIKKSEIDGSKVRGSFNFDSISYYLLNGNYYNSREENFKELAALIRQIKIDLPQFKVININGQHFYNAGATAVQELSYSLASFNEYLAQITNLGLGADEVLASMRITFGVGSNYFMEIAKLRAARMLFARIAEQYKPKNPNLLKVDIHAISGLWNKSVFDPYVNLLRLTTECMSAAIGGASAITLIPFNGTYKKPDDFSKRLARNIQLILKEEAYLDKIIDPASGSYYIESLTDELAQIAWNKFRETEEKGGMLTVMENGTIKMEIENIVARRNMDIATRKTPVLGTNIFPNLNEKMAGECNICNTGDHNGYLTLYRGARIFEDIRLATEKFSEKNGKRPKVFLATYGNLAMRKARATFSTNFFGCAGYEILEEYFSKDIETTVNEALNIGADIFVICSSDEEYAGYAGELSMNLKQKNKNIQVVIAGYPKDMVDSLKAAGVDDFIHVRVNVAETLAGYNKRLGIN